MNLDEDRFRHAQHARLDLSLVQTEPQPVMPTAVSERDKHGRSPRKDEEDLRGAWHERPRECERPQVGHVNRLECRLRAREWERHEERDPCDDDRTHPRLRAEL
jgi:hypothetical protein